VGQKELVLAPGSHPLREGDLLPLKGKKELVPAGLPRERLGKLYEKGSIMTLCKKKKSNGGGDRGREGGSTSLSEVPTRGSWGEKVCPERRGAYGHGPKKKERKNGPALTAGGEKGGGAALSRDLLLPKPTGKRGSE